MPQLAAAACPQLIGLSSSRNPRCFGLVVGKARGVLQGFVVRVQNQIPFIVFIAGPN